MMKTLACSLHFRFCVTDTVMMTMDLCGAQWWSDSCKGNVLMRTIVTVVAHLPVC